MPVTAQDFIDCIVVDFTAQPTLATEETKQAFDALLSRARQEAYSEGRLAGLEEMYNAWDCYHGASEIKGLKYITQKAKESIENLAKEYFGK